MNHPPPVHHASMAAWLTMVLLLGPTSKWAAAGCSHDVDAGSGLQMTTRVVVVGACIALALLAGCGRPDIQELNKLACQQIATTFKKWSYSRA